MNRTFLRRRLHPLVWMAVLLPVLLGLDAAAWLVWLTWHMLPWLLAIGVTALACRRWQLHRRALAWLRGTARPRLVQGQVVADDETGQLRAELDDLRAQVARLESAACRPIEAVIASYERIGRQYGPAASGKPGRQP